MPYKDPEKERQYHQEYYVRNRSQLIARALANRRKNADRYYAYYREYRAKNNKPIRLYNREYRIGLRASFFETYGQECARCGENILGFLTLAHKNNDGGKDRLQNGGHRGSLLCAVEQPDFTQYETQCYNCQRIARLNHLADKANKERIKISEKSIKSRLYDHHRHTELRQQILSIYGRKCACCGETDQRILELAHKENDGGRQRRENSAIKVLKHTVTHPDLIKYEILCANCNQGAAHNGDICPHKTNTNAR